MKKEKVKYKLPSGRGYREVTFQIIEKGLMKGMRKPISAKIIKRKKGR